MKKILETAGLAIGYKGNALASDLNLSLGIGEVTALIGRNGAGKSTLIKTITGNLKPVKGSIEIEGRSLESISRKDLSRLLAVVSTDPDMAGGLRLKELVGLGRIPYTGRLGILSDHDKDIIKESMNLTGVYKKKDCFISELSDGERQKGIIARGLAQQTPVIVMDEPFSYLDVASRLEILKLLKDLAASREKALLFSTHDVAEALRMADKIWLFTEKDGILTGSPEELIQGGKIDLLFPDSSVKFDRERKDFFI